MRLILLRHGNTEYNKNGIMQGRVDSRLTKEGEMQAEKLSEVLVREGIDVIYSSDLGRCKATISPFLDKVNVPVNYTPKLRERDYGIYDGGDCSVWLDFLDKNAHRGDFSFRPEGGESFYDVQERISKEIVDIVKKENGKNILISSHGSALISFLIGQFEDGPTVEIYEKYRFSNTAYSIVDIDFDGKMTLDKFNCRDHLNG